MTERSSKPHALIITHMFSARLYGVVHDAVQSVLMTTTSSLQYGASGCELAFNRKPYYHVDPRGFISFKAGLVPRVKEHLEHLGFRVEVRNLVTWHTLLHANHAMRQEGNETLEDQRFLDAVADSPRGLVVVRGDEEVAWLIAKLRSFFPTAAMLIVAANTERADRFNSALSKLCEQPVKRTIEGLWSMPVKTLVCTEWDFTHCSAEDWTVVIFTDCASALASESQKNLCRMFPFAQDSFRDLLTYCFVRGNEQLGPNAQLQLERLCGGEIYREPEIRGPRVDVTVLLARMRGCPSLPRRTGLETKRVLWEDAARNTAIARLASIVASGNKALVKHCGLLRHLPTDSSDRSVAVLVESTVHGHQLLDLLPGWRLQHEVAALNEPASGRSHMPVADHCVATQVYALRNGVGADILIRADGARDWPLSSTVFASRAYRADSQAVIIDVVDAGGGGDACIQRRIEAYERRGWRVDGSVQLVLDNKVRRKKSKAASPAR